MQEQDIIARYFIAKDDNAARLGVALGPGDDAAALVPPAGKLVLSCDTLNAGVHFFADAAPRTLARKAAAVSLSDIAAMGGRPLWLTVALSAPAHTPAAWFAQFARGLQSSAREYDYAIVGGDLTRAAALSVTTTAIGVCQHPPLTRGAAQAGDEVWVSGHLGAAAHALHARQGSMPAAASMQTAQQCLHDPAPRLQLAAALSTHARAMMDISDGLLTTAQTIATQSGVALTLDADALPAPPSFAVLTPAQRLQCAWTGGDDYELLWTAPPAAARAIAALGSADVPVTRIGIVAAGQGARVLQQGRQIQFDQDGYSHDFGQ